jgi:hypothetical protein
MFGKKERNKADGLILKLGQKCFIGATQLWDTLLWKGVS